MNIKPIIYDSLTPRQRLAAAVDALARGDDAEHERLNETCPKKHYTQADYHYSGVLQGLMAIAVSIEHDLTRSVLSMMVCLQIQTDDMDETAGEFLQHLADIYAAWNETLESLGVDPEAMAKLAKPVRHPIVDYLLTAELPEPDPEAVQRRREGLESFFGKLQGV